MTYVPTCPLGVQPDSAPHRAVFPWFLVCAVVLFSSLPAAAAGRFTRGTGNMAINSSIGLTTESSPGAPGILVLTAASLAPSITSSLTATGTNGSPFTYQIIAANAPTAFSATGLPTGLVVSASSGIINGTPAETGTFTVPMAASNASGTGTAALILTVQPPPAVTILKANNNTTIDQAASWAGGVLPTALNIAQWNGTYTSGTVGIGAGLSIYTLQISSPSQAITIGAGSGSLTLGSGGIDMSAATQNLTIAAPVVLESPQNWNILSGRTLTSSGSLNDKGQGFGITKSGTGTLVFTGSNNYSGLTNIAAGTLQIGSNTATPIRLSGGVNVAAGSTLAFNTQSSGTTGSIGGGGTVTDNGTGTVTINQTPGFSGTIANVNGASAATVTLAGAPSSMTTISDNLNVVGQTVAFNGGTWTLAGNGGFGTSLVIKSGTVETLIGSSQNFNDVYSLTMSGGYFSLRNTYSLRMGNSFGAGSGASNAFTGVQTGGFLYDANQFELGGTSGTYAESYTLSSGTLEVMGSFDIGANATNGGQTTFRLNGGTLIAGSTLDGTQGAGAKEAFVWTGGTLAASTFNATDLTSGVGIPVSAATNTLVNAGGTIAPGAVGNQGRMNITGNYTVTSPNACMAIDIGGTNQATTFAASADSYDNIAVSGTISLSGSLSVTLENGFVPSPAESFEILYSTASGTAITGAFSNVAFGSRCSTADGNVSFVANLSGNAVVLNDFLWTGAAPAVSVQPVSETLLAGKTAVFSVSALGATPLIYQWYFNGSAVAGGTNYFLSVPAQGSSAGSYYVTVSNTAGSVNSSAAILTVGTSSAQGMMYQMDQTPVSGDGAILDALGNTEGSMTGSSFPAVVAGAKTYTGNAWNFNAGSADISVASNAFTATLGDINQSTGITVGTWVNFLYQVNLTPDFERAAGLGSNNGVFDVSEVGGTFFVRFLNDNFQLTTGTNVMDGNWHHVVATLDYQKATNNAVLYVDGAVYTTTTVAVPSSFSSPGTAPYIGSSSGGGGHWGGSLDQFFVYNRAMTSSEVATLYTSGSNSLMAPNVVLSANPALVQWPANTTTLLANATDPNPSGQTTLAWSLVSAPSGQTATISASTSATTAAQFSGTGTYLFQCTGSNSGLKNYGNVAVTVEQNLPPVINSISITPAVVTDTSAAMVDLNATATDDGLPNPPGALTTAWTQTSGPAPISIQYPQLANITTVMPQVDGTYVLQFSAYDGALTTSTTVSVTVVSNMAPYVAASATNQDLVWNGSSVTTTLVGNVTDDRLPSSPGVLSGTWTQVSGPATATLSTPTASGVNNGSLTSQCNASFPTEGQYVFQFAATDGALTTATTTYVTVWSPGKPLVLPGSSRSTWLPSASLILSGSLSNATNSNDPVGWSVIQAPPGASVTFSSPNSLTTSATFSAAGTYWLQLSATDGAYSNSGKLVVQVYNSAMAPANYPNTTTATGGNFGYTLPQLTSNFTYDLGTQYNFTGFIWSRVEPPPPVGVHPRILFNPEDVPDIRRRLTASTTEGPVLLATINSFTSSNLTTPGGSWTSAYNDLATGVTTSFAALGSQNNMIECMAYEAFRCLIESDTTSAVKLCAALTTASQYEYGRMKAAPSGDWRNANELNLGFEGMGYAYDFAFNFMTPAQQQILRQTIAYGTTQQWSVGMDVPPGSANTTNWILNNSLYLIMEACAVEGEPGADPNLIPRLWACFERFYEFGVLPDGALYEGMGKGALYEESLLALGKRGLMLGASTAAYDYYTKFAIQCLETYGYGFTWDELLGGNNGNLKYADCAVEKYFYPNDPVIDFLHRNEMGPNYLTSSNLTSVNSGFVYSEMVQLIRAITVQDFDVALNWQQANAQQIIPNVPLTQLLNNRGLFITRSDWTSNGMRLMFQPRSEQGGHSIPDRGMFNLDALGRVWVPQTATDNVVATVPRIDNNGPSILPCAIVDYLDSTNFSYAAGDESNAYYYGPGSGTPCPLESFTYNDFLYQPSTKPWAGMLELGMYPNWYSGVNSPQYDTLNIGIQKAYRTTAVVRGGTGGLPYAVIVDDIRKDNSAHNYNTRIMLAPDLTTITMSGTTDAVITSSTGGNVSMLARVLRCSGSAAIAESRPENLNSLDISSNTVSPDFIVMLLPYRNGTALPTTTWNGNVVYVRWPGGQVDHIAFTPNLDGRTRLSFQEANGTSPPAITVPANIVTTATAAQGNVVSFVVSGSDTVDGTVPVTCVPPSGSIFPIGTTTVTCTATDSNLNSSQASFTVTVQPGSFVLTAPGGLSAYAANQSAVLTWNAVPSAASYNVYRSLVSGSGFTQIASGITATTYIDSALTNGVTYYYQVSASNGAGTGPNSGTVSAVPLAVPASWLDGDIGTVGVAGYASISGPGAIVMTAAGTGVGGSSDSFNVVSKQWKGNCAVVAHFLGFGGTTGNNSTAGIMLRQSLASNSANAFLGMQNYSDQYYYSYRTSPGGSTSTSSITHAALPQWMMLVLSGSTVTAYESGDALPSQQTWEQDASPATIQLSSTIYAGVGLFAASAAAQVTGTFDHFGIYTPPILALPANLTIPATSAGGAAATFVVTGSGNVDGAITPMCNPPSGSTFPIGMTTVRASATDSAGEVTSGTFSVTVEDVTPPVLTLPSNMTVNCTTATGAYVTYTTSAIDVLTGTVPTINRPPSGSFFPIGTSNVTTTATNASGLAASGTFSVTVIVPPISSLETQAPAVAISGSNVNLTIQRTVPGRTYQLQNSASMQTGSWVNIGPVETGGGGTLTLSGTFNPGVPSEFFRLLLGPGQ